MSYRDIINLVAIEEHTTPEEVDKEIRAAIKAAGYEGLTPEAFILLCATKVKSDLENAENTYIEND